MLQRTKAALKRAHSKRFAKFVCLSATQSVWTAAVYRRFPQEPRIITNRHFIDQISYVYPRQN